MSVDLDLRRLIVRHRHVAPMVSSLLAGTDARVRIVDGDGSVILNRDGGTGIPADAQRFPITAERAVIGWVEGDRIAAAVAAVLSYAANRETVRQYRPEDMPVVGLAVREDKKVVDKITKGARMHE